jgi:hypothetical protein
MRNHLCSLIAAAVVLLASAGALSAQDPPSGAETPAPIDTAGRTPLPPTPTPALPEEGGPPGGVLSGRVYVDGDGDGTYNPVRRERFLFEEDGVWKFIGEDGGRSEYVHINRAGAGDDGNPPGTWGGDYGVAAGDDGVWEARGLPDGRYRIMVAPPVEPEYWDRASPPVQQVALGDNAPPQGFMVIEATVKDASRTYDLDFLVPPRAPSFTGMDVASGGDRSGGGSLPWLSIAGLSFAALVVGAWATLAFQRR